VMLMGGLLIWRHRGNIQKLMKGTESKLGQKSAATLPRAAAPDPHSHPRSHSSKHSHKHGAKS